jgi:hypothetical protein
MTSSERPCALRIRARSWVRRIAGRSSTMRIARQPIAGLSSFGKRQ